MIKLIYRLFGIVAVFFFVAAGILLFVDSRPGSEAMQAGTPEPPFVITQIEQDLGRVRVGPRTVAYEITNPASRPRRLIGKTEM